MEEQLERLEARVLQAIGLIKDLRQQNASLQRRCAELQEGLQAMEDEKGRLAAQLAEAGQAAAAAEDFEIRRQQIERKVGSLLEKLEAMG